VKTPPPAGLGVVIYEGAGSEPLAAPFRFEILRSLLEKGYPVSVTDRGETRLKPGPAVALGSASALLVIGRFTEDTPAVAEEPGTGRTVHFRRLQEVDPPAVLDLVESVRAERDAPRPGGWKPWFPVIDYTRCTNCMQCLSFCLFDVYGVSKDQKIQVQKPVNCKTDCPACSRVCPEVAILFPKYKAGPINGDEVSAEDLQREKMKVDISALLGGDIYAALRQRSQHAQTRFAKERDEQRALEERKRCLAKLQQALDVPPEVLAALPSPDEIRQKASKTLENAERGMRNAE
jgi:NAD-dependent dihydropyrimidine dehydrogenase PreA subunit